MKPAFVENLRFDSDHNTIQILLTNVVYEEFADTNKLSTWKVICLIPLKNLPESNMEWLKGQV